jgi:putative ABC transport system permease protein
MFRHYLIVALRHLARSKRYFSINILGMAIGFAVAILIGLFVRDELTFDRSFPDHERTYLLAEILHLPGRSELQSPRTQSAMAALLKLDFPAIETIARLTPNEHTVRRGEFEVNERVYWADPTLFEVLPLPVRSGTLQGALEAPDSLVISRRVAEKYFGRDDVVGQVLEIDRRHPLKITAVLEDLPATTHLDTEIIASGRAPFSALAQLDANPQTAPVPDLVYTYLRLRPNATREALQAALPGFLERRMKKLAFAHPELPLVRIDEVHLVSGMQMPMKPGGDLATVYAMAAVALLVVLIAATNFINLMTARATRRATEIGIRKTEGATRRDLIIQFVGESVLYTALAMLVAMLLVELLLPTFNAFLGRAIPLDYWLSATAGGAILLAVLIVGILAAIYPALILSSFPAATVLKNRALAGAGSGRVRQGLVIFQFASLLALMVCTAVVYRQVHFALNEGMRIDKDQVIVIASHCDNAFKDEITALPGVLAAACAWSATLAMVPPAHWGFKDARGTELSLDGISIDFGLLELYGLGPLAGRFFSREHPDDLTPPEFFNVAETLKSAPSFSTEIHPANVVLNEAAVRRAGFASPQAAIGQTLYWLSRRPVQVIGVVRDFAVDAIHAQIVPAFYVVYPTSFDSLSVKLRGHDIPETLGQIDALWLQLGDPKPIKRFFLEQRMQEVYADVTRRGALFGIASIVALLIACIGLFGLAAFTAERRTKEIGVRKVMGAANSDIMSLLLWQFTKPVLWANLIAWPVSALLMTRWLSGFAYHVDLEPWIFVASMVLALTIALLTVSFHSYAVARANPVTALRYE